jgi:hypothetical protein
VASLLYRTATTVYPCYLPILGESTGAGRIGLADAKVRDDLDILNKSLILFKDKFEIALK